MYNDGVFFNILFGIIGIVIIASIIIYYNKRSYRFFKIYR